VVGRRYSRPVWSPNCTYTVCTAAGTLYCPLTSPDSYCRRIDRIAELRGGRGEGGGKSGRAFPLPLVRDPVRWYTFPTSGTGLGTAAHISAFSYRNRFRGTHILLLVQKKVPWYTFRPSGTGVGSVLHISFF
jgi:hypothetical protein